MMARTRAEGFGPEVTRRVLLGTYALSAGYYDAFYGQAQQARTLLIGRVRCGVPAVRRPRFADNAHHRIPSRRKDAGSAHHVHERRLHHHFNLAGHPAISVPSRSDADGLPIGFQVMAPALGEAVLFRVARAVEAIGGPMGRPVVDAVAS